VHAAYAEQYRTLWQRHWWWRSREAFLLGWIERLNRRSALHTILDVGCGDGLFFERLERFGRVEGLEPDASLVSDPRWRSRIRIAPLEFHDAASREYDLVLMLDVLEHIADDGAALGAAWSAIRPGGHVLLTVPALPWLWSRHDEANQHYRRYDASGLRRLLEDAGFVVETVRYFFLWTVAPLLVRRWIAPAGAGAADYEVPIPPAPINRVLDVLSRGEHAAGRFVRWPIGSSLLAIARRPAQELERNAAPLGTCVQSASRS
jgi:SAM-dependent methyltransferase